MMMSLKKWGLLILTATSIIACNNDDDDDNNAVGTNIFENLDSNPNARLLYETVANLQPIETFNIPFTDPTPGKRVDFQFNGPITGEISGEFIGYDYAKFPTQQNGNVAIDVFGTITTHDGVKIAFRYKGESFQTGPLTSNIQETGYLSTNHPDYAFVNDLFIIPVGDIDLATNQISVKYYAFENDPFNGNNPYVEETLPDYYNFPFTWDNIQTNPDATLVYEASVNTTGIEGFGANPTDVFTGAYPIPAEGLRMDIDFAGTTQGEINGDISGVDYVVVNPDGSLTLNVRGKIETANGAVISLKVNGISVASTTPGTSNLFETIELKSGHSDFNYLNDKYIIGVGTSDAATGLLSLRLYRFDQNPL